jgi:hypothetical protein
MPLIPALGTLKQEDGKLKAILGNIVCSGKVWVPLKILCLMEEWGRVRESKREGDRENFLM